MKYPLAIFTAAATAVTAMVRMVLGDAQPDFIDTGEASVVPRITPWLVEKYAGTGATDAEIADRFQLDVTIIQSDYRDVLRSARAMRKLAIRSYQFELAKKLNGPMLTWLGRNELGQSLNPAKPGEAEPSFEVDEL